MTEGPPKGADKQQKRKAESNKGTEREQKEWSVENGELRPVSRQEVPVKGL